MSSFWQILISLISISLILKDLNKPMVPFLFLQLQ